MSDAAEQLLNLSQKELDKLPADVRDKIEAVRKQVLAAQRLKTIKTARNDLLDFVQMSMPDPRHPGDATKSRYKVHKIHEFLARKLEAVERGETLRLCISVQPRVGKSQLVSKSFPAWMMGRDPYKQIILAGYGDEFVKEFGRDVRNLMLTPFYTQVFPEAELNRNAKAANRQQTTAGGIMTFAGLGGQLTGKGADCLPKGTLIDTDGGAKPIDELVESPYRKVLSYNHETGRNEYKEIEGVARRKKAGLRRVTTTAGRVVTATADHRVWTARGYVRADELTPGDRLVCSLRGADNASGEHRAESGGRGENRVFLLPSVLVRAAKRAATRAAYMRGMRGDSPEGFSVGARQSPLLQSGVPVSRGRRAEGSHATEEHGRLRNLRGIVRQAEQSISFLFAGLRRCAALVARQRGRQPQVEGWSYAAAAGAWGQGVPVNAPLRAGGGRAQVRGLWSGRPAVGGTPPRQRPDEQPGGEPCDVVRYASQGVARGGEPGRDTVAVVEELHGSPEPVYDLQIADNHNFYANGVLVHNCLIIDDPIKNAEEARSKATKDKLWEGFTRDAMSRLMGKAGAVVITATRWAEDDLIGRLTDPDLGYTTAEDAASWEVINIPAFAEEDDPLGRDVGEVLWEERTPRAFLDSFRRLDPAGFAALYMGRPSPPEGNFFKREHLRTYRPHELPDNLRYYAASDHAISTEQGRDSTVLGVVGVDEQDNIYVLSDVVWAKLEAHDQVEAMLELMRRYPIHNWWAEKGHISKSIGPFLRKRMQETNTYCAVTERTPVKDKQTRAQAVQARMAMGKVFLPATAPWYNDAVEQMLNFPNGAHDDFVDFLAWVGIGLASQVRAESMVPREKPEPKSGSLEWILKSSERIRARNSATERTARYLH